MVHRRSKAFRRHRALLLDEARRILAESGTDPEFDVDAWLCRWLERPNLAMGGQAPAALLNTDSGAKLVFRALGAMQSGAYL